MPRYFFHVMDGRAFIDSTGLVFEDEQQARLEAIRGASEMLVDPDMSLWLGNSWVMSVADEDGYVLFNLRISIDQTVRTASLLDRRLVSS